MKKILISLIIVSLFTIYVFSQDSVDAKKAKTMVKKGLEFYKTYGKEKFLNEVINVKGKFVEGEFYLFVFDYGGDNNATCIARGDGNAKLIGTNMWEIKDPTGKLYIQEMVKIIKEKGSGTLDYKRTNPTNKKIEDKSSYIERIPDTTIYIGCGFYK